MENKEVLIALRDGLTAISSMIDKMLEASESDNTIWMTTKQASIETGAKLKKVQHLAYEGRIVTKKIGQRYYVDIKDLKKYLSSL